MPQYKSIFSLKVMHSYYRNGRCQDFEIFPLESCQKRLRNHRMRVQKGSDRVIIKAMTDDENNLFISPQEGLVLSFGFKLLSPTFCNFTDYSASDLAGTFPEFTNEDGATGLTPVASSLVTSETNIPTSTFCIASIQFEGISEEVPEYTLTFHSLSETWKYFLISSPGEYTSLKIEDTESEEKITFAEIPRADASSTDEQIFQALADKYPTASIQLIQSETPVLREELGRQGLQLIEKSNQLLIDNLQNPPPGTGGNSIINLMTVNA